MATVSGILLYEKRGYVVVEEIVSKSEKYSAMLRWKKELDRKKSA